jgi:O-antigen ligase
MLTYIQERRAAGAAEEFPRFTDRLMILLLGCFAFTIPWENSVRFAEVATISRLVGLVAMGGGIASALISGRVRRVSPFLIATVAFSTWAAVTFFWTDFPRHTQLRAWQFIQLLGLVWLVHNFIRTQKQLWMLLGAFVLGCWVAALDVLGNFPAGNTVQAIRFVATGADPNELALTLVLGVPVAWALREVVHRRSLSLVFWAYPVGAFSAVLLTGSRGALLAGAAAVFYLAWEFPRMRFLGKVATAAVLGISAYVVATVVPPAIWQRMLSIETELQKGSYTGRAEIWAAGWEVFLGRPVLGVGAGAYAPAVAPVLGKEMVAHNSFLSVLVEQGLLGLGLFAVVLLAAGAGFRSVTGPTRRMWIVVGLTWFIGVSALTWEHRKTTWLLLACLGTHAQVAVAIRHPRAHTTAPQHLPAPNYPRVQQRGTALPGNTSVAPGLVR